MRRYLENIITSAFIAAGAFALLADSEAHPYPRASPIETSDAPTDDGNGGSSVAANHAINCTGAPADYAPTCDGFKVFQPSPSELAPGEKVGEILFYWPDLYIAPKVDEASSLLDVARDPVTLEAVYLRVKYPYPHADLATDYRTFNYRCTSKDLYDLNPKLVPNQHFVLPPFSSLRSINVAKDCAFTNDDESYRIRFDAAASAVEKPSLAHVDLEVFVKDPHQQLLVSTTTLPFAVGQLPLAQLDQLLPGGIPTQYNPPTIAFVSTSLINDELLLDPRVAATPSDISDTNPLFALIQFSGPVGDASSSVVALSDVDSATVLKSTEQVVTPSGRYVILFNTDKHDKTKFSIDSSASVRGARPTIKAGLERPSDHVSIVVGTTP